MCRADDESGGTIPYRSQVVRYGELLLAQLSQLTLQLLLPARLGIATLRLGRGQTQNGAEGAQTPGMRPVAPNRS